MSGLSLGVRCVDGLFLFTKYVFLWHMAKKTSKKRAGKYDKKLSIKGSFGDVIKVSVDQNQKKSSKKVKK